MEPARRGRKPKGVRTRHTVQFPSDQLDLYREKADAQGLALGDWIALQMATAYGLPLPDYLKLELTKAAQRRDAVEDSYQLRWGA